MCIVHHRCEVVDADSAGSRPRIKEIHPMALQHQERSRRQEEIKQRPQPQRAAGDAKVQEHSGPANAGDKPLPLLGSFIYLDLLPSLPS
jgi:hypothetical protein